MEKEYYSINDIKGLFVSKKGFKVGDIVYETITRNGYDIELKFRIEEIVDGVIWYDCLYYYSRDNETGEVWTNDYSDEKLLEECYWPNDLSLTGKFI